MEKDYEDTRDIDNLSDGELRAMVRDELEMQLAFDPDDVDVSVNSGVVSLSGRVGTDEELRIVERVVTDIVGIEKVKNDLFVDPIRRAESPEAIENIRSELFGTTDVREAIEGGIPWNPPDGPTPEGASGVDEVDEPPEATNDR